MATWPEPTGIDDIHIIDINSVISAGWSGEELLQKLIALDYQVFEGLQPEHEGVPEQWAPVFMNHPDTWRLIATPEREIVGYWHFVPLFSDLYKLALRGELLDREITADRVRMFELPGVYNIYFVSIGMMPRFRRAKSISLLFKSLLQVVGELAQEGVFIGSVCANAYTDSGISLCRSLGMDYVCQHIEKGRIFSAAIRDILEKLSLPERTKIQKIYRDYLGLKFHQ